MSTPKIRQIQQQLEEFRQRKNVEQAAKIKELEQQKADEDESNAPPVPKEPQLSYVDHLAVDVLNIYPFRKWREWCAADPYRCWIATGCFWATGLLLAAKAEFGVVYFMLSAFTIMFLNLGSRKEGEMSAYSVFNPNCERLLGQMTSEHFERDMMMRRNVDE